MIKMNINTNNHQNYLLYPAKLIQSEEQDENHMTSIENQ